MANSADIARLAERLARGDRNLDGADLSGADLTSYDLHSVSLRKANLDGADLTGMVMDGVNLSGASAVKAIFEEARLHGAILHDADFRGAIMPRVKMDYYTEAVGSNFTRANLKHAYINGSSMSGAVLDKVDANGSTWRKVSFNGATVTDMAVEKARFHGCDFTGAKRFDLDLRGAISENNLFPVKELSDVETTIRKTDWTGQRENLERYASEGLALIGEGLYSKAYMSDRRPKRAIKISHFDRCHDEFVKFAMVDRSPHTPKIYFYRKYDDDSDFTVTIMEFLDKGYRDIDPVARTVYDVFEGCAHMGVEYVRDELELEYDIADHPLMDVMARLVEHADRAGCGMDLHPGNVMSRNGTAVILDPFV